MLLDEGLEEAATQFALLITQAQFGTGTTLPTASDTGLQTPVAATLLDVTVTVSGASGQFTHALSSAIGNGSDMTEHEYRFANGDSLDRVIFAVISKTASFELNSICELNFVRV